MVNIGRIILFIIVVASFCLSRPSGAAVVLDRIVAVVNNEAVTWSELYVAMETEPALKLGSLSEEEKLKVKKQNEASFLEALIDLKLQLQEAKRLGMKAGAEDVDAAIEDIKRRNSLDDKGFIEGLEKEGITLEKFREKLAEQVLLNKVVDREVRGKTMLTASEIKRIEEEGGELYRIRQIFFKPGGEEKAMTVYDRLAAGEDFAELAKAHSEDATAKSGGDLGLIKPKTLALEFQQALKGLKPGEFSRPFQTSRGTHIVKLEQTVSLGDLMLEGRFQEIYQSWLRGLREKAHIENKL